MEEIEEPEPVATDIALTPKLTGVLRLLQESPSGQPFNSVFLTEQRSCSAMKSSLISMFQHEWEALRERWASGIIWPADKIRGLGLEQPVSLLQVLRVMDYSEQPQLVQENCFEAPLISGQVIARAVLYASNPTVETLRTFCKHLRDSIRFTVKEAVVSPSRRHHSIVDELRIMLLFQNEFYHPNGTDPGSDSDSSQYSDYSGTGPESGEREGPVEDAWYAWRVAQDIQFTFSEEALDRPLFAP
ncbi:hypothetical protein SISNIDRAFT_491182 [Sistotremastrum niveocremeum HHB9708]|uniref:Uncharacterized protein n=1 Tax=Sistotremastrum niveocremeum HHB9708 TaxID=1314777 RepID=A0A164N3W4_9AGAM|nr:hypothetical protein SISNIDRAFT_491182 [Sistotremastrum niveocremeum HHB9708]